MPDMNDYYHEHKDRTKRHEGYRNQAAGAWLVSTVLSVIAAVFAGWTLSGVLAIVVASLAIYAMVSLIAAR